MVKKQDAIDNVAQTIQDWQKAQGVKIVASPAKLQEMAASVVGSLVSNKLAGPPLQNATAIQQDGKVRVILMWQEEAEDTKKAAQEAKGE